MSQSNESVTPEELVNAHRSSYNQLERAKRVQDRIHQSGLLKRGVAKVKGETGAAQTAVAEAQKAFEATLQVPKEKLDAIQGRANEILATRAVYEAERTKVAEEVAPQYKKRVESITWPGDSMGEKAYMNDYEGLEAQGEKSPETLAKALAVRDVFFPKIDNPGYAGMTFVIGEGYSKQELAIHNGSRFPRFEIGSDQLEDATSVASANGWDKVVKMSVSVTGSEAPANGEEPYVIAEKSAFTAVSDETAALLEIATAEMNSSSSLSEAFGHRRGMGTGTASHIQFSTLNVAESAVIPQTA